MATWDTLTATATDFGSQQQLLNAKKAQYSATTIPEIFYTEAKALLRIDLQEQLNLRPGNTDDDALLDDIVTYQEPRMKAILATKQMQMFFENQQAGPDSSTFALWKHYSAMYENMKRGFRGLITRQGSVTTRLVTNMR